MLRMLICESGARRMTTGVGGSTLEAELASMRPMREGIVPIDDAERLSRIAKAQRLMRDQGVQALYLDVSTNLFYFTGIRLRPSERLHGAIIPADGDIIYLSPAFEEPKTRELMHFGSDVRCWEEHEDPTALVIDTLRSLGHNSGTLAIDPMTPFFTVDGLRRAGNAFALVNGASITGACRMLKTPAEIALIQRAMEITLEVHKVAARIMHEGITTTEVLAFLQQAHVRLGATLTGSGIVLFGEPTAYPHGVPYPQTLRQDDMVLIDVGAEIEGYRSDITRSYVFGEANTRQRQIWQLEKSAQLAAFAAAKLGASCESVDAAARGVIEAAGFGPGYATPGLPHRTGHGIGLDVHEDTYIVKGNRTPLAPGMCFSNEPMICIYGEFGVRLEDHIYMTQSGPNWFTQPCHSVDDPFGYES
jgi:Xaa-Pro dipeptidase